jgi:hypothetical protein
MKNNLNRRREIFEDVVPRTGTKEYEKMKEFHKNNENNPEWIKYSKKNWEKITRSLEAQKLSSCGFFTEDTLRYFLTEFNSRAWRYGLRSMPVMFNIMEAFFNYKKPEIYFELIEDENYLISFFDFIDFITSNEFKDDKSLIEDNLTSNIVYNFNVGKDLEEIKFKTEDSSEFIVAGASILRRENEVTVLVITGKKKTEELEFDIKRIMFDSANSDKDQLIKDAKKEYEENEIDYIYIDEEKKYIKVVVACRIDLDTMTIDARYVGEETNLMFNVSTDEIDGFLNEKGEFSSDVEKEAYQYSLERINKFHAIFEVAKTTLYLPYYFNSNEKLIVEETLETPFKKLNSSPITKRKFIDVLGFKCSNKSLYTLDKENIFSPDTIKLRDDLFKIETSGYWKKIKLDEIGLDKKGNPVHGRTWVNKSLSWFQASDKDLILEKNGNKFHGPNAGYIYILRNPPMEENIFKIGLTRNTTDERAAQLSKTSVPDKFYKMQEWNVKDCIKAEKEIHSILKIYRVDPRREFFRIEFDKAVEVIKKVVDSINNE